MNTRSYRNGVFRLQNKIGVGALAVVITVVAFYLVLGYGGKRGLALAGSPWRLLALASRSVFDGCSPKSDPVACRISGSIWVVQGSQRSWTLQERSPGLLRFELRSGDIWSKDATLGHTVERSELMRLSKQSSFGDFWLSFKMKIEPGSPITSRWVNLGQLHNTADPGEFSPSPPWAQRILDGERFQILARWTSENPLRSPPAEKILFEDKFVRGQWSEFLYHFRLSYKHNGFLRVWRNRRLIVNYTGPLGYPDDVGPYFKFGLYRSPAERKENLVGWFSEIKISEQSPNREQ